VNCFEGYTSQLSEPTSITPRKGNRTGNTKFKPSERIDFPTIISTPQSITVHLNTESVILKYQSEELTFSSAIALPPELVDPSESAENLKGEKSSQHLYGTHRIRNES
jgi:hypothetical protein